MRVLVAGDYCPRERVAALIENGKGGELFSPELLQKIRDVDYAIVNFECAVVEGNAKPILKCGPNLKCSKDASKVLKDAGFDCVTLANNHFRDFADEGVEQTLHALRDAKIDYVGGGMNIDEAEKILYKDINGDLLAIINVCENEFSIASKSRAGSAPLDTVKVYHRIVEARQRANFVLVIVHGGHEHFQLPSPRMKDLYRFFIEVGADSVVNHHQHCYSGFEEYLGKPIFYGIGNFCFDHPQKRGNIWNEGYMVTLVFENDRVNFEISPFVQCDENPVVAMMVGIQLQKFNKMISSINNTIENDCLLEEKFDVFVKRRSQTIVTPFTPYNNEYVRAAAGRHYIPYMIPRKKMAEMLNYVICESHRDILVRAMRSKLE